MSDDSSRKEKKKEELELIININNQSTIKSFSFPLDKVEILKKFETIAKREKGRRGFSLKLQEIIEKYVQEHWAGNEQLLMAHYVKDDELNPNHYFCNYSRGRTRNGKVFCTNFKIIPTYERIWVFQQEGNWVSGVTCYSCKFNKLRKK